MKVENMIIIGSGCAGWTAGLYAGRANLEPLLFTGQEFGGQIATTTDVENYPGFPDGITGPELIELMQKQAERFGTRVEYDYVREVDFKHHPFAVRTERGNEHYTNAVVIATGASPHKLGIPGESENIGRGVSYCATCDGFFFRDKEIMVVGGGDSALQEGLFLTKFGKRVRIAHRRDQLRAGATLQKRAFKNEKIEFIWDTVMTEIRTGDDGMVDAAALKNVKSGEERVEPVDGVFIYIGHYPNTHLFKGQLDMNEEGYLLVDERMRTNIPGVFAAGEVHDHIYKQAITSAGFGCAAAMEAEKFLAELEDQGYPGLDVDVELPEDSEEVKQRETVPA